MCPKILVEGKYACFRIAIENPNKLDFKVGYYKAELFNKETNKLVLAVDENFTGQRFSTAYDNIRGITYKERENMIPMLRNFQIQSYSRREFNLCSVVKPDILKGL